MLTHSHTSSTRLPQTTVRSSVPPSLPILEWLFNLHTSCPVWLSDWERALEELSNTGRSTYRGRDLEATNDGTRISPLPDSSFNKKGVTAPNLHCLFCCCHADISAMVNAMGKPETHSEFRASLKDILLTQFPHDKAWTKAIRHKFGIINAKEKRRAHDSAIYPRILAERRHSLVLIKQNGEWKTRKGMPLESVLSNSHDHRKTFINLMVRMPGLTRIEIPTNMDFEAAIPPAEQTLKALLSRNHTAARARRMKLEWEFAIRRIRGMGLKGCFDPATQSVIVDPRHMDTLRHEICHWLLGHEIGRQSKSARQKAEEEVHALMKKLFK